MAGPLEGVKVLDLTSNFMGPYASLLLADMGADVCKVEGPAGDATRGVGPCRNKGMSAIFLHLNRNKRSMVLDLKAAEGLAALKRMLCSADVLMFSMRPKTMAKLGLAWDDVRELNPGIVYCGGFGFGQNGPYADHPAYDDLIQAGAGMPVLQSRRSGPPAYVATAVADRVVGMALCNAVTTALFWREKTGRGQSVQVPMYETFAHFVLGDHLYGHTFVPPIGDWGYARMMSAERRPYRTLDGYIGVQVYNDKHWQRFFRLCGRADLAADPRYADIHARTQHIDELYDLLARTLATNTSAEWVKLLVEQDIPAIEMKTPETLLDDAHMRAVGFFQEEEHPSEGRLRSIGIAQRWSETPPAMRHPAPRLGEHTRQLLAEFGFAPREIEAVLQTGAAQAPAATLDAESQ